MGKILLCVSLIFIPFLLSAQVSTYNKTITFSSDTLDTRCSGIVDVNGQQFVCCCLLAPLQGSDMPLYNIGIAEVDSLGNKIWSKIISEQGKWYDPDAWYNCLSKTSDGNLILTGGYRDLSDSLCNNCTRTFLMKLNLNGGIIWFKVFNDTMYSNEWTNGLKVTETADHGFAVIGRNETYGSLYKSDSLGNLLWDKSIGTTMWYEGLSEVLALPDSGVVVGSYCETSSNRNSGDPIIYKFDKAGKQVWRRNIGSLLPDEAAFPQLLNDSTLIILTTYTLHAYQGDPTENRLRLLLMSTSGRFIKDTLWGGNNNVYVPFQVIKYSDGTFIGCGSDDLTFNSGWILGFTGNFDSLFFRSYSIPDTSIYSFGRDLHGITVCSDLGLMAVGGYSIEHPIGHGIYQAWMLKTDRYGCLKTFVITNQPSNLNVRKGDSAVFAVRAAGNDSLSYQWYKNGNILPGRVQDTLLIVPATEVDTGKYFCSVSGSCRHENSISARLSINYTSTNKLSFDPLIVCFPNPTYGLLSIKIENTRKDPVFIMISDLQGRQLLKKTLTGSDDYLERIDVKDFEPAVYFLEVRINDKLFVFKVLKIKSQ